jgi:hypothetical protein
MTIVLSNQFDVITQNDRVMPKIQFSKISVSDMDLGLDLGAPDLFGSA